MLVAGGGPAGMAAAVAAAEAGAQVMLVEEEHELGGHLRWGGKAELDLLGELRRAVAAHAGIEVLTDSVVAGRYDDNWMAVLAVQRGSSRRDAHVAGPRAARQGPRQDARRRRRASSSAPTCSRATTCPA